MLCGVFNYSSDNNKPWGGSRNLISRIVALYSFENLVLTTTAANYKVCKDARKLVHTKKKQSVEIVPEEAQTLDLLGKDIKSSIVSVFKDYRKPVLKN